MIRRIQTENSIYVVDTEAKTWHRVERDEGKEQGPHPLRTVHGAYNECSDPVVGLPLFIVCDPLPTSAPGTIQRVVQTSPVVSFEEL